MSECPEVLDSAACARWYQEQQPQLVAYARSLTGDPWLAEDLVAEACFRVWRRYLGHAVDDVPGRLAATVRGLVEAEASPAEVGAAGERPTGGLSSMGPGSGSRPGSGTRAAGSPGSDSSPASSGNCPSAGSGLSGWPRPRACPWMCAGPATVCGRHFCASIQGCPPIRPARCTGTGYRRTFWRRTHPIRRMICVHIWTAARTAGPGWPC